MEELKEEAGRDGGTMISRECGGGGRGEGAQHSITITRELLMNVVLVARLWHRGDGSVQ